MSNYVTGTEDIGIRVDRDPGPTIQGELSIALAQIEKAEGLLDSLKGRINPVLGERGVVPEKSQDDYPGHQGSEVLEIALLINARLRELQSAIADITARVVI